MQICPKHKEQLEPIGQFSLVCPRCDFKQYRRDKYWLPEVRHLIDIPSGFSWSTWTLSGCEASGVNLVMSTGVVTATALSPELSVANSTKNVNNKQNIRKLKIDWTHTDNDGSVKYAGSNDGGTTWTQLGTENAIFRLNKGKEIPLQDKYYDLRLLITLYRDSGSDTSPSISQIILTHDYKTK